VGLFDSIGQFFVRLFVRGVIPREPVVLRAVGVVRNGVREPRARGWEGLRSDIIVREELIPALEGIETYSHVIVIFYMHQVPEPERARTQVHPRHDERYPLQGVFATRTPSRPNPVGVAVVPLVRRRREPLGLPGRGLDLPVLRAVRDDAGRGTDGVTPAETHPVGRPATRGQNGTIRS